MNNPIHLSLDHQHEYMTSIHGVDTLTLSVDKNKASKLYCVTASVQTSATIGFQEKIFD